MDVKYTAAYFAERLGIGLQCVKKKRLNGVDWARIVAKKRGEKYGVVFEIYLCPACGGYHLTTKKREL